MKVLRTPDRYFKNIKNYPFKPIYTNISDKSGTELRIHHIDEGPKNGPILLAMHGQPVWSYLYSKMIPILNDAGIRVIAPDLVGYGKSDKPSLRENYSYQNQVDWMNQWMVKNNLENLTFFGQDWGGLIGLRMIADHPNRFMKISIGNTGLPYLPNTPKEVIDEINEFRKSKRRLTPLTMIREVRKMDSGKTHPALKFMYWQKFCWDSKNLPVGLLNSTMMEYKPKNEIRNHYILHILGLSKISPYMSHLMKAYEAPFPSPAYKMGCRAMPSHVPIIPDQSLEAQKKAREFFSKTNKPFLSVFAGNDPVTNDMEKDVLKMVPNAIKAPHIGGGHFFQWTKPKELSKVLIDFIKNKYD
ncbi:MAG: haloalkane dehalogenase [Gammaproteobacteria bacterium]|nr:haloalkane dehalogenase [Gammaproteobacteria bacterium]